MCMKDIGNKAVIKASKNVVWDLLVNPEKTPEYMYTCAIETDFKVGSPLLWRGIHDQVVYVSGELLLFEPEQKMSYTVIDPNANYPQTPENHLLVEYILTERDGKTLLEVRQSGYQTVAQGQERYDEAIAGGGWSGVLETIKEMAERK